MTIIQKKTICMVSNCPSTNSLGLPSANIIYDVWVKDARDYAKNEEPVIKLLKAEGACPPEDCGGVWGYADLLELKNKKRKTAEDKERLEWYDISKDYNPKDCDLESLQDDVEALWLEIKDEMDE